MRSGQRAPETFIPRAADTAGAILIAGPFNKEMVYLADRILGAHRSIIWRTTCADAIRSAADRRVEVVLAARRMDDGDWTVLLSGLARLPSKPPLVVLSADRSPYFRQTAMRLGAAGCVSLRQRWGRR